MARDAVVKRKEITVASQIAARSASAPAAPPMGAVARNVLSDIHQDVVRKPSADPPEGRAENDAVKWLQTRAKAIEPTLLEVLSAILPAEEALMNRRRALEDFANFARRLFPGALVEPFGSYVMNLSRATGDLDISVGFPSEPHEAAMSKQRKVLILRKLEGAVRKYPDVVKNVVPNYFAKVPVLMFHDAQSDVTLDVGIANFDGVFKSNFFLYVTRIDPRFRPLCFLIKSWARHHKINDAKLGTLNTFSLYNLVAVHLQTEKPAILPPFAAILGEQTWISTADGRSALRACEARAQEFADAQFGAENKQTVAELFVGFFQKLTALSSSNIWRSELCASSHMGRWTTKRSKYAFFVEDFLSPDRNTARAIQKGTLDKKIMPAFHSTIEVLRKADPGSAMRLLVGPDVPSLKPVSSGTTRTAHIPDQTLTGKPPRTNPPSPRVPPPAASPATHHPLLSPPSISLPAGRPLLFTPVPGVHNPPTPVPTGGVQIRPQAPPLMAQQIAQGVQVQASNPRPQIAPLVQGEAAPLKNGNGRGRPLSENQLQGQADANEIHANRGRRRRAKKAVPGPGL